ncbi:MAG TPA: alkaline phosphatase family protein, partial [Thermoplasmata archaeon]|nr:alkaline phosphatase family protein [Thermoplasmata archaeon]
VAGPSTPNHLMLITADSPVIDNPSGTPSYDLPSLPESLAGAGFSWENYGGYAFGFLPKLASHPIAPSERFVQDAASGKLPSVAWVYAPHALSEHPPDPPDRGKLPVVGNVTLGMEWTTQQLDALVRGGLWPSTAVFLTWDDWGGWFDHVDPPPVEAWVDGTQFRYGSRVPCLVLSPFARAGYISHSLHSHVSLVRFCEVNFGLPPLNARDRAADAMQDCFDFSQAPLPPPSAPAARSLIRKEGSGPPGHASGRKGARAGRPPGRVRR